jgi:hypothetical protein
LTGQHGSIAINNPLNSLVYPTFTLSVERLAGAAVSAPGGRFRRFKRHRGNRDRPAALDGS